MNIINSAEEFVYIAVMDYGPALEYAPKLKYEPYIYYIYRIYTYRYDGKVTFLGLGLFYRGDGLYKKNCNPFFLLFLMIYFRFWPKIDDAIRRAALEARVRVRMLISWWRHSQPAEDHFLASLAALARAYPRVDIQVVSVHTYTHKYTYTRSHAHTHAHTHIYSMQICMLSFFYTTSVENKRSVR